MAEKEKKSFLKIYYIIELSVDNIILFGIDTS